jgi:chain length determinant protein EpsF
LAATVVVSVLLPKQYTATASVLVDIRSQDPILGTASAGVTGPAYMASQVEVLRSERVTRMAIRALRLDDDPLWRQQWLKSSMGRGDFEAWLAAALQKGTTVEALPESNVVKLAHTAADPRFAAAFINALMQAFIDLSIDMRVEPAKQYSRFFDTRAQQLRETLDKAKARLSAYRLEKGIVSTDERFDIESARLGELSSQLVALQAVADESGSRQAQAGSHADRLNEVLDNKVVADLTTDLSRQEARLFELRERLGEQHPQVKELLASIAQLRSRRAEESRRVVGSVSVNNSVNQSRIVKLRALLAQQRAKVLALKAERDEVDRLGRDVDNAQREYEAMLARAQQSDLAGQNTQTNVSVLKQATEPVQPSSPRLWLNTAVALLVGALLGLSTALLRELRDHRLRTADDVIQDLGQMLLVQLPVMRWDDTGTDPSRTNELRKRVLSGS